MAAQWDAMNHPLLHSLSELDGQFIVGWTGCEMALSERGERVLDDEGLECFQPGEVQWSHPEVPYLQMIEVVLGLGDGRNFSLLSQHDDGSGVHGLYLISRSPPSLRPIAPTAEIFRVRELVELPTGLMQILNVRRDATNNIIELLLKVGTSEIRLLSGEIYEREGGRFDIVEVDGSILVQIDGKKPLVPASPEGRQLVRSGPS